MRRILESLRFRLWVAIMAVLTACVVGGVLLGAIAVRRHGADAETLQLVESTAWIAAPLALAAAGVLTWILLQLMVSPLAKIAAQARRLSASHIEQRIKPPGGGHEMSALVGVLNEMLDRLEAAFHAQERFVANASHELRTPITVLLSQAQVLGQQQRDVDEYERFVRSVQDELHHLATLVESLLTLAQADAGAAITPTPAPINDLMLDVVQRREASAHERGVRLIPTLAMPQQDGPEAVVDGDAQLLRTMLDNLVRNAIRHSPTGEPIEISVAASDEAVEICVADRGPGIPSALREQVFERFFQIPAGASPPEGIGLGLAIAKAVAKLHRGEIHVDNRPDGGCEFHVTLPLSETALGGE